MADASGARSGHRRSDQWRKKPDRVGSGTSVSGDSWQRCRWILGSRGRRRLRCLQPGTRPEVHPNALPRPSRNSTNPTNKGWCARALRKPYRSNASLTQRPGGRQGRPDLRVEAARMKRGFDTARFLPPGVPRQGAARACEALPEPILLRLAACLAPQGQPWPCCG